MGLLWTILWVGLGAVLLAAGAMIVVGACLPRDHVASGTATVGLPRAAVWSLVRDPMRATTWRGGLDAVEGVVGPAGEPTGWTERSGRHAMPMVVVESVAGERLVTRIADAGLPFGGTWTIELEDAPGGSTLVRVTERGFVSPPPFRFLARFVIGHDRTLQAYLGDLSAARP